MLWIDSKVIVILIFLFSPSFEVILALYWKKKNPLVALMGLGARHTFTDLGWEHPVGLLQRNWHIDT